MPIQSGYSAGILFPILPHNPTALLFITSPRDLWFNIKINWCRMLKQAGPSVFTVRLSRKKLNDALQKFIDYLSGFFNVISINAIREINEDEKAVQRRFNKMNAPSFIQSDKTNALKGALMDYYLLCKCNCLIYCMASIPLAALLTNENIESIMVNNFRILESKS